MFQNHQNTLQAQDKTFLKFYPVKFSLLRDRISLFLLKNRPSGQFCFGNFSRTVIFCATTSQNFVTCCLFELLNVSVSFFRNCQSFYGHGKQVFSVFVHALSMHRASKLNVLSSQRLLNFMV